MKLTGREARLLSIIRNGKDPAALLALAVQIIQGMLEAENGEVY